MEYNLILLVFVRLLIVATKHFKSNCVIMEYNLILLVFVQLLIVATKHFKSDCVIMESQTNGDCMVKILFLIYIVVYVIRQRQKANVL